MQWATLQVVVSQQSRSEGAHITRLCAYKQQVGIIRELQGVHAEA